MKILGIVFLALVLAVVVAGTVVVGVGSRLPVNHVVSVSGIVAAPPEKVFGLITNLRDQPKWRSGLQQTDVLPRKAGRDHWVEHLDHGQTMTFLATETDPPTRRVVQVEVPGDAFGGKWIYFLTLAGPGTTQVTITEDGYVRPAAYRFVMVHVLGADYNLKRYLSDLQAAAAN
jgi:uncharacterized protein YndB with AHSA1/START domain